MILFLGGSFLSVTILFYLLPSANFSFCYSLHQNIPDSSRLHRSRYDRNAQCISSQAIQQCIATTTTDNVQLLYRRRKQAVQLLNSPFITLGKRLKYATHILARSGKTCR